MTKAEAGYRKGWGSYRRRKCAWPPCGRIVAMQPRQACCSRSCGQKLANSKKSAEWRQERTRRGYTVSIARRKEKARQKWLALAAEHGVERALALAYTRGYNAGRAARRYYELSDLARERKSHVEREELPVPHPAGD